MNEQEEAGETGPEDFRDTENIFIAKEWITKSYLGPRRAGGGDDEADPDGGGDMAKRTGNRKRPELKIDYPADGETVWTGHYAARISAPGQEGVEISVDGGPWLPCRNEAGHWWFDLEGLDEGRHQMTARPTGTDGAETPARRFKASGD